MEKRVHSDQKRNYGIDVLKVIAIMIIIFSHSVPKYGDTTSPSYIDFSMASGNIQTQLMLLFIYGGQLGNCIFIVCSSYLMIHSDRINIKKVLTMIFDSFIISIIYLCIVNMLGYSIPLKETLKQFLPVTFGNNWFVGCYLLFYILHPLIRQAVSTLSQKENALLCAMLTVLYILVPFIFGNKFYYTELVGFITIYILTMYIYKYWNDFETNTVFNKLLLLFSLVMILILIIISNFLGQKYGILKNQMLRPVKFTNPLFMGVSYSSLNLLKARKIKWRGIFAKLSSLSLLIYLIHNNCLFKNYCLAGFWKYVYSAYSYQYVAGISCSLAIALFISAAVISLLYSKVFRGVIDTQKQK